ncbi:MAG: hypothetical protein C0432_00205 [Candidatus Puniceispirillum sp.]|nr:hypothetical protein [Candidatus Pelagibacter sp.]MBA4282705.1 hypothetical protein [Candidatus Puniceispirillum sp.]
MYINKESGTKPYRILESKHEPLFPKLQWGIGIVFQYSTNLAIKSPKVKLIRNWKFLMSFKAHSSPLD